VPLMTSESKRLVLAFVLAPLAPSLVLFAISLVGHPLEGLWGAALITPISYIAAAFPGSLLYFIARRLGIVSAATCTLIGCVSGGMAGFCLMWNSVRQALQDGAQANWAPSVTVAIIAGLLGGGAGFLFWWLSRARSVGPMP
jgi:hypothetical protein